MTFFFIFLSFTAVFYSCKLFYYSEIKVLSDDPVINIKTVDFQMSKNVFFRLNLVRLKVECLF